MTPNSTGPPPVDALEAARERLQIGPVPDWVVPCDFGADFKPKHPGHTTYLLLSRQLHAEKSLTCVHVAVRLETIQAVERHSQWRLEIQPQTQRITLHWIKVHRNGAEFDQTTVENLRPAQRESDALASAGKVTLSLLLEDVRPGDILEWCYTIEEQPPILPEVCACFFALPAGAPLGELYFSVRFQDGRPMRWKSSAHDLEPVETKENGATTWVWMRENPPVLRPEENTPAWHISYPWIQVSDCADWETVAAAHADAWRDDDSGLEGIAQEISSAQGGVLQHIDKALHLVQDEYRHLAGGEDLAGQVPAAPEVVARRRFGNGLDLSIFLVRLLNRLGVAARPVLVNTTFRKSVAELLPMPGLFDHVVVEYQARGETRWVDATAKGQGGGSLRRVILDYGVGLPAGNGSSHLVEAPGVSIAGSAYEVKESLLLDTAGSVSLLSVIVTARGSHAEEMRRDFNANGADAIARRRLQFCLDRFTDAQRNGPMVYRDDRAANEFFLAETFAVKNFLTADAKTGWYKLEVTDDFAADVLKLPDPGGRRTPFVLPYPCHMAHSFEVHCVALPPAIVQERTIANPWLQYTRMRKTLSGFWTVTSTLSTLADSVPADRIDEYRESVREIRAQSAWSVMAPTGQERPHQRSDFGQLPVSWSPSGAAATVERVAPPQETTRKPAPPVDRRLSSEAPKPAATAPAAGGAGASVAAPGPIRYKRRRRHRRRHRENKKEIIWQAAFGFVLLLILLLLVFTLTKSADHLLSRIPAPDVTPTPP
jgi:hypothetical protein